jgi:PAS domain S-box-containing protein
METLRKIVELIEQNKTLEQRNEELKNIIVANLDQNGHTPGHQLTEAIDFSDTKNLFVRFFQHHKIPTALFDEKGKLIFSVGWKNSCELFHPNYDEPFKDYNNLLPHKKPESREGYYLFQRKNGLHTIAIPVEIKNRQVATLLLSQFFLQDQMPCNLFFEEIACKKNMDIIAILSAVKEMPVFSEPELKNIIQNASLLTETISFIGTKNIEFHTRLRKQADSNLLLSALLDKTSEQEMIIKSLLQNISIHHEEVKENTISKPVFQKQQKLLIHQIEHTENILNSLLTSMPLGIGFVRKNVFTYVNDYMFRILGYTPKELIGRDPQILFTSSEDLKKIFELPVEKFLFKETSSFETRAIKRDGGMLDVMVFISLIDGLNLEQGITVSIMDISSIKKTQKELIVAKEKAEESDRLKSAFLDNMSHEFRTPMNAILGFTALIVSPYITQKQKEDYLKIIHNNGKKLLRIVDDIIDISKMSANQLQVFQKVFPLHQLMLTLYEDFTEYVNHKHGEMVKLILTEPANRNNISLYNDDIRLDQVMRNLLSNSLKFTSQGSINFGYELKENTIQFFVADTGKGIRKNQLPYIFERFRQIDDSLTREHGGTGLGLSLAKGLIELMGGKIEVESKWGKGTTVYFTLPLYIPEEKDTSVIPDYNISNQIQSS